MARPSGRPLRDEIIESATSIIQRVGVSGFSYAMVAEELGVKAPSIHHHFRTKEDLVAEVAAQYRRRFAARAEAIDAPRAIDRLTAYADLYGEVVAADRFCLCGAVAAEWLTVGDGPKAEVHGFFQDQLNWLARQISDGIDAGDLRSDLDPADAASALLAGLEGAMLLGRAKGRPEVPAEVGALLINLARPADVPLS